MSTNGIAADLRALKEAGIVPDALAGFSLGEIAALTFSGAVDFETGFNIVCRRGEFMQEAAEAVDSAMAAKVTQLFLEMTRKEGITILMTTHDVGLMDAGDMIIELNAGEQVHSEAEPQ